MNLHKATGTIGGLTLVSRVAGFARWEIYGDFDRRPLTRENDAMVVTAWNV